MFGDDQELRELRQKWPDMTPEEKKDTFLWKMVWFHHQKHIPGNPNQAINDLTETLKVSSESSGKLTKSIRNATWVAAVVGGLGVLVAAAHLLKDLGLFT
jgi:hypothetical protein